MAPALLPVIAGQQWRLLVRDRRLTVLGLSLLLALLATAIAGAALHGAREEERRAAQTEEGRVWASQGLANPHGAAHFGRYFFKPVSPLAVIDPGLLLQLGTSLKVEAHANNPARTRAIDGGTALDRFGGLSPATMLQMFAPLLVILSGFAAFSGERARGLLRQELAAGVAPGALIAGRLVGLGATVALLIVVATLASALALAWSGGGTAHYLALLWMMLGYGLYLLAFAALTLAASAAFASARTTLVLLLGFWTMTILFVPRVAPTIAETLAPTLSGPAFEAAVTHEVRDGPSGHDPQDARLERLREATMKRYGVTRIEDLPVDFNGIALFAGEQLSTAIYRRHFAALYDGYDRQAAIQRGFALLSPFQAMRPWSAALAQSDQHAHRRFLEQADGFRYDLVQTLNRAIIHRPKGGDGPYLADVAAITREARFSPSPPDLREALARHWLDLALLALWAGGATLLAFAAAKRLGTANA
jgi:ABC-2 type transport system permease protein